MIEDICKHCIQWEDDTRYCRVLVELTDPSDTCEFFEADYEVLND